MTGNADSFAVTKYVSEFSAGLSTDFSTEKLGVIHRVFHRGGSEEGVRNMDKKAFWGEGSF